MKQRGQVVSVANDTAHIVVSRQSACGSNCAACGGNCAENKVDLIEINDAYGLKAGDYVELETDDKAVLSYIGLVYGVPLVFFILGFLIGISIFKNIHPANYEIYSGLVGLVALIISYFCIRNVDKKFNHYKNAFRVTKL